MGLSPERVYLSDRAEAISYVAGNTGQYVMASAVWAPGVGDPIELHTVSLR